jgi:glycosyltransferase involved in cell wall biosynthesis
VGGVDVYGRGVRGLSGHLGVTVGEHDGGTQGDLHAALAQRRAYLHLNRWTSLSLTLLEAMSLGMPVIVLGTTDAAEAVPDGAGIVSTNVRTLVEGAHWLCADHDVAREMGRRARQAAQWRYGLKRFLADWELLLGEVDG